MCVLAVGLLGGCHEPDAEAVQQASGSVYRHTMDGAPTSLDPAHASNIYANFLAVNLYDTLYRYKYLARPYELEPNLATALPEVSGDGRVYTIRLKANARFIDDASFPGGRGRPVTAQDFV
jgi:ABC-type oligopeptide transport system substrate-binding subunit